MRWEQIFELKLQIHKIMGVLDHHCRERTYFRDQALSQSMTRKKKCEEIFLGDCRAEATIWKTEKDFFLFNPLGHVTFRRLHWDALSGDFGVYECLSFTFRKHLYMLGRLLLLQRRCLKYDYSSAFCILARFRGNDGYPV